jgi:hypothetical protein
MLKEKEVTEDMPAEAIPGANPEVTKIVKEKQCASDGFDDTGAVHDRTSDDVEEGERVEV